MKVITLGMGQNIYEENSAVRRRMVEYGNLFEELHVIVFTPDKEKFKIQKLSQKVFLYPSKTKIRQFYFFDFLRLVKIILKNKDKKEFVLSTQDPFETGIVGLVLKLVYKLPLQVQVHTDFANKYFISHSILNFIRFPLGLFVLSFADSVRVVSERIARSVHSLSYNISVLPIFTEANSLEPRVRREEKEKIKILTVARLEREKDLETAIKAFQKLIERGIDATFTIVGDGSERKTLEVLTDSLGIGEKVKFLGWQNNLEEYYQDADVYVSTSLYEGYGMSIVEAASFGLALVISDTGVAGDLFRNNEEALICRPKDVSGFADAMFKLISDRELMISLGQNAKITANKNKIEFAEYLSGYRKSMEEASQFFNSGHGIFKKNILLRYLVAGITGASTQIGLLYVFTDILHFWYLYSSVFSFLAAIIVSFLLQKFWTFADNKTEQMQNQFFKYIGVAIFGLLINTLSMFVLVDFLDLWYILAQIITGAFIAVINFLMYKFFIFNK